MKIFGVVVILAIFSIAPALAQTAQSQCVTETEYVLGKRRTTTRCASESGSSYPVTGSMPAETIRRTVAEQFALTIGAARDVGLAATAGDLPTYRRSLDEFQGHLDVLLTVRGLSAEQLTARSTLEAARRVAVNAGEAWIRETANAERSEFLAAELARGTRRPDVSEWNLGQARKNQRAGEEEHARLLPILHTKIAEAERVAMPVAQHKATDK
jgi:hypothetical protein